MRNERTIGLLLILGAIGVFIPYTILTIIFEYPDILRQDTSVILTKFHEGGSSLIFTWFCFAILGLPFIPAYIMIGQKLENKIGFVRWSTTMGIISVIVQMVGLLRWTFVVPVLANNFVTAISEETKEANKAAFQTMHQFGGVLLGEHLGQLFTIIWTVMMCIAFNRLQLFPKWLIYLGYISSAIYILAQAELFKTVIPSFPVWDLAGFIGSTLWLVWLIIIGIKFLTVKINDD